MKQERNTKQRQLVLDAVRTHSDHPTADQIYLDARSIDGRISRGTVYRNLNLLVQKREILLVKIANADRFDWRLDFHYHLLCTTCGVVRDAPVDYRPELDQELVGKTDFLVYRHRAVFEGLCPGCQRNPLSP